MALKCVADMLMANPNPPRCRSLHVGCGALTLLLLITLAACRSPGPRGPHGPGDPGHGRGRPGKLVEKGIASWYGPKFHGRRTANGEVYDMDGFTAAHRTLPFGTWVEVINLDNGRRALLRINDRGPFVKGRVIDVSRAGARELGLLGPGTARVEVRLAESPVPRTRAASHRQGPFLVQVGAFAEAHRAELLHEKLRRDFPSVRVDSDGTWHRVRIGPYEGRSQAERTVQELRRLGMSGLIVSMP